MLQLQRLFQEPDSVNQANLNRFKRGGQILSTSDSDPVQSGDPSKMLIGIKVWASCVNWLNTIPLYNTLFHQAAYDQKIMNVWKQKTYNYNGGQDMPPTDDWVIFGVFLTAKVIYLILIGLDFIKKVTFPVQLPLTWYKNR